MLVELKALRETVAKIAPANAVFTVPETLKVRALMACCYDRFSLHCHTAPYGAV
jgi:hypothetical protein